MGLIESSVITEALKKCRAINPYTIFIGEGWKMYDGPENTHGMDQSLIVSTTDIAVFSDEYRDIIKAGGLNEDSKGFVTGKETNTYDLFQNCLGNPQSYFKSTTPENVVNYVACHDGLTLHDCIAHNCHLTENTSSEKAELLLRIKLANFILLTSRGIAFLNAGQERGRTKSTDCKSSNECVGRFVRNSYNSSDNINNFVWNLDKEYLKLLEYTKRLILFRKAHSIFRNNFNECDNAQILSDIPKKALVIGYILSDRCREDDTKKNVNLGKYVVLVNASKKKYKFNLSKTITRGTQTIKVVFDANGELKTAGVTIKKSKVLVAELECFSSVILYIQ